MNTLEHPAWIAGGWIQTYTGRAVDPYRATVDDIDLADIAHALSQINRFGGHTLQPYNVAEHCVRLANHFEYYGDAHLARWALLHDAAEAYIGDMVRPIKVTLPAYVGLDMQLTAVISERFDLTGVSIPVEVREADTRILLDERKAMLRKPPRPWDVEDLEPLGVPIIGWAPGVARRNFLATAARLGIS